MEVWTPIFADYVRKEVLSGKDVLHLMPAFYRHAKEGTLPTFSWIDPGYFDGKDIEANDQHPDHNVAAGEKFIKRIYESLRAGPAWEKTLFIIMYDEHGGFFDHVQTPAAPQPDKFVDTATGFTFNRTGVRIPTLMVSPLIPKGLVVGKKPGTPGEYTASSLSSTLRKMFTPNMPFLTKRDAWADTFDHIMSLSSPRTDCPKTLPDVPDHRGMGGLKTLAEAADEPVTAWQQSLVSLTSQLSGTTRDKSTPFTQSEARKFVLEGMTKWKGDNEN